MRLIHFADLHLGVDSYGRIDPATGMSSRVVETLEALDQMVDFALANDVDLVLFCGDAYKNQHPTQTHQRELAKRLKRLAEANVALVLVAGNHCMPVAGSLASTLDVFGLLLNGDVTVARRPMVVNVPSGNGPEPHKAQVLCVPWPNPREVLEWATAAGLPGIPGDFRKVPLEELTEVVAAATSAMIANLSELMVLGVPKILAAHLAVEGTKLGSEQSMMLTRGVGTLSYQQLHPRLFDYVALGHHHLAQEVGLDPPGAYAGSMMRVDFGESDDGGPKGFYVVDIEQGQPAEVAFVPVRSRRFVTVDVRPKQEDPMAEVVAAIEKAGVADAIVRVIVRLSRAKAELFREAEVRRALEAAHSVAYIKREIDQDGRSRSPDGTRWEDLGPIEALRLYLRQKGAPGDRLEELVVAAQRLLGEQEHAEARAAKEDQR